MKKFLIVASVLCLCIAVYAKSQDDKFINALRSCASYTDSGNVTTDGINAISTKVIAGWHDGKCAYKEAINLNGAHVNIQCRFPKTAINEITSVADAYYMTLQYSKEQPDTSSEAIKNNPLANVFNKYLQDPSVCSINMQQ